MSIGEKRMTLVLLLALLCTALCLCPVAASANTIVVYFDNTIEGINTDTQEAFVGVPVELNLARMAEMNDTLSSAYNAGKISANAAYYYDIKEGKRYFPEPDASGISRWIPTSDYLGEWTKFGILYNGDYYTSDTKYTVKSCPNGNAGFPTLNLRQSGVGLYRMIELPDGRIGYEGPAFNMLLSYARDHGMISNFSYQPAGSGSYKANIDLDMDGNKDIAVSYGTDDPDEYWINRLDSCSVMGDYTLALSAKQQRELNVRYRVFLSGVTLKLPVAMTKAGISVKGGSVYNGKKQLPKVTVTLAGQALKEGQDYQLAYKNNVNAGTASVTVTGLNGNTGAVTAKFTIAKASNPLKAKGKTATVKFSSLQKKDQTLNQSKVMACTKKGEGRFSYKLAAAKQGKKNVLKYFKVNPKTGQVTVKKGLEKGTCKLTLLVKAAGNTNYKASSWLKVTVTVKVK